MEQKNYCHSNNNSEYKIAHNYQYFVVRYLHMPISAKNSLLTSPIFKSFTKANLKSFF